MSPQGVYPAEDVLTAGDQISSTDEGRHITLYADNLVHAGALVTKGLPVVWQSGGDGEGVGIPFATQASGKNPLIAIDTEGIWAVDVVAVTDVGLNAAVVPGDRLYINRTTCVVSKISAPASQIPFGLAIGNVTSGETNVIAVKVHFDPLWAAALKVRGTPGDGVTFVSIGSPTYPLIYNASGDKAAEVNVSLILATGAFNAMEVNLDIEPTGDVCEVFTIGFKSLTIFKAGVLYQGAGAGIEAIRGELRYENTSEISDANAIFCAIRGKLTKTGTPVFTDAEALCTLFLSNQVGTNMTGLAGGFKSAQIYMATDSELDAAIRIHGIKHEAFIYFDDCMGGCVETSTEMLGRMYRIKCLIDYAGGTVEAWILAQEIDA